MLEVLEEPLLEFRFNQALTSPHDGLTLFGPFDADHPSKPAGITYAALGPARLVEKLAAMIRAMRSPILPSADLDPRLWPAYPGFDAAFHSHLPEFPARTYVIDEQLIDQASRHRDEFQRVAGVTELYLEGIRTLARRDEVFDVAICLVPEFVYLRCRPEASVRDGLGHRPTVRELKERIAGQLDLFGSYDPEVYRYSVDFRRQLKARSMKYKMPIQIVRESTLDLGEISMGRMLTPLSDRAWNLSVALYYKAGGKPWRLNGARPGVCYIGLAYRRTSKAEGSRTACCAAQMFLDTGDGIVFMGEYGPWYSPKTKEFHLSPEAAMNLLAGVLKTYRDLDGRPLTEIFIHSRSSVSAEEFRAFRQAAPEGVNVVCVRVRRDPSVRLFRHGKMPVLRGSFLKLSDSLAYLWGAGYKPRLGTYDGWEVPVPLELEVQHGEADIRVVARDIFALTKLNYNACRLGDAEPVTVAFSDAVGEILVSNPTVQDRNPNFKYYI